MQSLHNLAVVAKDWADVTGISGASRAFAHHGLAVTTHDEVLSFHAGQLVTFDRDGHVVRTSRPGLTEGHGLTIVREGDQESVWIADPGFAIACGSGTGDGALPPTFGTGLDLTVQAPRVVKVALDGVIELELDVPPSVDDAPGPFAPYAPTSVAVDEARFGGNGDVWVADGYGSNVVHRFSAAGQHVQTLTGLEGPGRFDCPHAVFIERRAGRTPELYVADRGNARIVVFDLNGVFKRVVGDGVLNSPTGFVRWGEWLVVVELFARLALLDESDNLVGFVGEDAESLHRAGWPNSFDASGDARVPTAGAPGQLNSPHAAAVDSAGDLIVGEWLIGGRYTKFTQDLRGTA